MSGTEVFRCDKCGAEAGIAGTYSFDPEEYAAEREADDQFREEWESAHADCTLANAELDNARAIAVDELLRVAGELDNSRDIAEWLAAEAEWKKIRQFQWYSKLIVGRLEATIAGAKIEQARLRELETVVGWVKAGEQHWDPAGCWEPGPLPTPDSANPDHLRFAAGVVLALSEVHGVIPADPKAFPWNHFELTEEADRLEAERAEDAAHEQLVTQLATIIDQSISELTRHLGVKVSGHDWTDTARAVLAEFDITPKAGA